MDERRLIKVELETQQIKKDVSEIKSEVKSHATADEQSHAVLSTQLGEIKLMLVKLETKMEKLETLEKEVALIKHEFTNTRIKVAVISAIIGLGGAKGIDIISKLF
jgi:uncharacterized protein (UPF0335 family)